MGCWVGWCRYGLGFVGSVEMEVGGVEGSVGVCDGGWGNSGCGCE